eukprot:388864-Amphidinium_carterae.2
MSLSFSEISETREIPEGMRVFGNWRMWRATSVASWLSGSCSMTVQCAEGCEALVSVRSATSLSCSALTSVSYCTIGECICVPAVLRFPLLL